MKEKLCIILALLPLACASDSPFDGSGEGTGTGIGTGTGGAETGTGSTSGTTDGPTGTDTGSETGSETGGETSTDTGDGDGDGDGDGGAADLPEEKMDLGGAEDMGVEEPDPIFPGDDCDPFVDECLDNGGDFECQQNLRFDDQNQPEVYFQCTELNMDWGDGMYASQCHIAPYEQCTTGFWCRSEGHFPANTCAGPACCIELCYFGQDCGGQECVVDVWQADLSDYLDGYDGIGHCP